MISQDKSFMLDISGYIRERVFGDRFRFSRRSGIGGGGWVHPKGADSMAVSGLCFGSALVGSESATADFPLHEQVEKTAFLPCMAPISGGKAFIPV